jgi:ABC-type nitrate/sulfonate/bicarbonate transport system permease component
MASGRDGTDMTAAAGPATPAEGARRSTRSRTGFAGRAAFGIGFPIVALIVWEIAAELRLVNPALFSQPSTIFGLFVPKLESGELTRDFSATMITVTVGFIASVVPGLILGLAMGLSKRTDYTLEPIVIGLYNLPIIALYPLLILWFGITFTAIIVLVVLFGIFPVIVNTALGIRLVDPVFIRTARSFGASNREILVKVMLPAALPSIVAGLELAMGRVLVGTVVAELFIGREGIGFSIGRYANFLQMGHVYFGIFLIGFVGVILTGAITLLQRRVGYES